MRVEQTGQICELRIGSQVLGRLANSGSADIQIGSETYKDEYMSRRHVQIDVVKTDIGIEHHLVEIGSKNIIQLNGEPIQRGDEIVLSFGDKLTLGKTDLTLEETDEDATRVI
jgi:pSer/pThr/pTyr-binding forkhead associated (FHA) protein